MEAEVDHNRNLSAPVNEQSQNNASQGSAEEDTVSSESSEGRFLLFYINFTISLDVTEPKWVLSSIARTARNGFTFHFQKQAKDGVLHLEMIRSSVSKDHINLICAKRPACRARGSLSIVDEKLTVVKENKSYKLEGEESDLTNTDNYGTILGHTHTKRCKGNTCIFSLLKVSFRKKRR